MPTPLRADRLIAAAVEATGLDDFGEPSWQEGLDVLVASLEEDAALDDVGVAVFEDQIGKVLRARLQVEGWLTREPGLVDAPVEPPTVVTGLPRTGTTLLSYLLDLDPENRSLRRWECFDPVPPPSAAFDPTDARVLAARAEMDALYATSPEFKAIHFESAEGPTECVTVLGQDFKSIHFETMANIPTYGSWLLTCDLHPAYRAHRRTLQVLQASAPGRWCLKSPAHNLGLEALVDAYPHARFVATHRDPATVLASLCRLVAVLTGLGTDRDFSAYIGRRWLAIVGAMTDRALAYRQRWGDDRFVDLDYRQLAADPIAAVRRVYDDLGWPLTDDARAAMTTYVEANPKGRHGVHRYALSDFGLDVDQVAERFGTYRDRFGV